MNYNSYECKILGRPIYKQIALENGMFTKKHTQSRIKNFKKQIKEELKKQLKIDKLIKSKI